MIGGTSSIESIVAAIMEPTDDLVRNLGSDASADDLVADWAPKMARIGITPDQAANGVSQAAYSCKAIPTLSELITLTLGEGWRNTIVNLPKVMIGVGKIYTDKGLAVIYPYVFSGTIERKRGTLIDGTTYLTKDEAVADIKKKASKPGALERFAEKHATGRIVPDCADVMYFKKYPEVWDASWGELPRKGKPNNKCPITSLD